MIFDGKKFSQQKEEELKIRVEELKKKGIFPKVTSILVGSTPENELYLRLKMKFSQRIGVEFEQKRFPSESNAREIISYLRSLASGQMQGKIIQLPLPEHLEKDRQKIFNAIDFKDDIDGLTTTSFELLKRGEKCFWPAVVKAVSEVMDFYNLWPPVKVSAVVGSNGWVGERVFWFLRNKGIKEILAVDLGTKDKITDLPKADLIISGVGKPQLITKELVKKDAIVFDLGVMVIEKSKIKNQKSKIILGDVDFSEIASKASFITPVPGGIGPVTIACLFENLIGNTIA